MSSAEQLAKQVVEVADEAFDMWPAGGPGDELSFAVAAALRNVADHIGRHLGDVNGLAIARDVHRVADLVQAKAGGGSDDR